MAIAQMLMALIGPSPIDIISITDTPNIICIRRPSVVAPFSLFHASLISNSTVAHKDTICACPTDAG